MSRQLLRLAPSSVGRRFVGWMFAYMSAGRLLLVANGGAFQDAPHLHFHLVAEQEIV